MKNFFKILVILIFTNFSYSQSIKNLDDKFGFKTISFNSKIDQYELLTKINQNNTNSKNNLYKYDSQNEELKKVFDEEFTDLFLSFNSKSSELEIIWLKQKIFSKNDVCFAEGLKKIESLKNEYEKIIGKPTSILDTKEGFGFIWQGSKVKLSIIISATDSKVNEDGTFETNCVLFVTFEKLEITKQKSGF